MLHPPALRLLQPSWTIPVWLFGPSWGLLYTAMGYAAHRVYQASALQNACPPSCPHGLSACLMPCTASLPAGWV
jgi:tryptophan-rich sensory protein